jgi:hypothetical protein
VCELRETERAGKQMEETPPLQLDLAEEHQIQDAQFGWTTTMDTAKEQPASARKAEGSIELPAHTASDTRYADATTDNGPAPRVADAKSNEVEVAEASDTTPLQSSDGGLVQSSGEGTMRSGDTTTENGPELNAESGLVQSSGQGNLKSVSPRAQVGTACNHHRR